ncbi:DUF934 domain-containing protein [Methyloversatilis sp. XJ19-13]|uniref:DUF934 domain-containing protein n=1 Tax=Methyloversatilis sp. XJ19-13 TaxID=2963430 RepID=UPI00211C1393|nr:DUF934 domain-containing protein [Methyloversatilis sp. XJ19-13]MCQ9374468.1 DUF934 domain-containing protein [Methyloversatilis sp. XJ19-13]
MAELIRGTEVVADDWTWVRLPETHEPVRKSAGKVVLFKLTGEPAASDDVISACDIPAGKVLLPLSVWLRRRDELATRADDGEIGVWLDSHEEPAELAESLGGNLNRLPLIGVNFPKFIDGRGYSIAFILRTRFGYRNQLRALGDVLRDQMFFFHRCGFDAYLLRADQQAERCIGALKDFTTPYQTSTDGQPPVFRRRAAPGAGA